MDLRKRKDYVGNRRKKINTMAAMLQGLRPGTMPNKNTAIGFGRTRSSAAQKFKNRYGK